MTKENPVSEAQIPSVTSESSLDASYNETVPSPVTIPRSCTSSTARQLPGNTGPKCPPLLETVLAIPHTIEKNRAGAEAQKAKEESDAYFAELDRVTLIGAYQYLDEEAYQARVEDYLRQEYHASEARREAALKKRRRQKIDWEKIRMYRDTLRRGALENGDLDFEYRDETFEQWTARMVALNEPVIKLWREHSAEIQRAHPKYIEGFPVRETIKPPSVWTGERRSSGRLACLQCWSKNMPCSLTTDLARGCMNTGRDESIRACQRCVRSGDRYECCVRDKTLASGWRKADMEDSQIEAAAENPELAAELDVEVRKIYQKCRDASFSVKPDFFNSHLQNLAIRHFQTHAEDGTRLPQKKPIHEERYESRIAPSRNKQWWSKKVYMARSEAYRRKKADGSYERADREMRWMEEWTALRRLWAVFAEDHSGKSSGDGRREQRMVCSVKEKGFGTGSGKKGLD